MRLTTTIRALLVALTALAATLTPALATDAAAAPAETAQQTVLYYNDDNAAEFKEAVAAGAAAWNASVQNVRIEKSTGTRAEIVIIADDGWPRAQLGPVRPGGRVYIWFGRQAVDQGYNTTRIASHEMGHSLGLPDIKPGPCSSLMSGSTAGISCSNPYPDAYEKSLAERNYGTGADAKKRPSGEILVDAP